MKTLLKITLLTLVAVLSVSAQNGKAEREIRSLLAESEQAGVKRDVAFIERVLADDYTYSGSNGTMENRAQALDYLKQQRDKPTYKIISFKTENQKVRVTGNTAIVTGDWTLQSASVDSPADEPHTDKGRITTILEKRNGRWLIVAEHESEQQHDRKLMEQEVLKAGKEYGKILARQDRAALERLFADEYLFTNEDGKTRTKAEDIAVLVSPDLKIESEEVTDQKVRVIGNNAAVETGVYRFKGAFKGKPIEETGRYTTTWVFRALRWQIVADHTSVVK